MNEPIGRFGSCKPARARRTASATARSAGSWPITRLAQADLPSPAASPSRPPAFSRPGTPVQRDTTPAMASASTTSFTKPPLVRRLDSSNLLLDLRNAAVLQLRCTREIAGAHRAFVLVLQAAPALPWLSTSTCRCCSTDPARKSVRPSASQLRNCFRQLDHDDPATPDRFSFFSASSSILSCKVRRSSSSSSSGLESTCIRRRERRFVHQIDGLIRQEAVGDVAVRQLRGGDDRGV